MATPEQRINALRFALSQRLDAARSAQDALNAELRKQGLPVAVGFYTAEQMDAERAASRLEARELAAAAIADTRALFDPNYQPDRLHQGLIGLAKSFEADAKRAQPKSEANVVQMIATAGRKRRGEET